MNVGVVGCGYWGRNLVRNFHQLGALAFVCEAAAEGRATAERIAPGVRLLESYSEALAEPVDALVLATPAATHYSMALAALQANKDVFVEKPLALTLDQGRELVQAQGDRILMVGHILEYHPGCQQLVELVREGALGELQYLYSNRLSLGKIRTEENVLWSFAPHDVALLNRLVGGAPATVSASGAAVVTPDLPDFVLLRLGFQSPRGQVQGHIFVSWLHPFKEQRLLVIGSRGAAVFDGVANSLTRYEHRVEFRDGVPLPIRGQGQPVLFPSGEPLRRECEAFLESVKSRRAPLSDGRRGLEALAVLEAAQVSLQEGGRTVTLPSEIENS